MKQSATLDSSFWIDAHRSGLAPFVVDRFDLHFTPDVGAELHEEFESGREFWRLVRDGVARQAVAHTDRVRMFSAGERSAMNLALEHADWLLLIDDRRPLEEAQRLGIRAVCTPAFAVQLFHDGEISLVEAHQTLARLVSFNTVSPRLIDASIAQLRADEPRRKP